jgi:hypothetical protein
MPVQEGSIPVKQIARALVGWLHKDIVAHSVSQTKKASEPSPPFLQWSIGSITLIRILLLLRPGSFR